MGLFAVCERKNRRRYAAPFMSEIDLAGHVNGYYGPAYYQVLATADKQIETLLSELDRQDLREDTLVIVSPYHGGGTEQVDGTQTQKERVQHAEPAGLWLM